MAEAQPSRWQDRWARGVPSGRAAVVYGLVVLFAFDALKQLDGLLRGMHRSGRPSFGAGDLVRILELPNGRAERVVDVWRDHAGSYSELATAPSTYKMVFGIYVGLDYVFAIALALLLLAVVNRLEGSIRAQTGLLVPLARNVVLGALIADLTRNTASAFVVGGQFWLEQLLWASALTKTILYAIAFVLVGSLVLLWATDDNQRSGFRTLRLLRVHVAVVGLFALALIAHEQIPDLIRRWSILQFFATLVVVALFAAMVWLLSSNLAHAPAQRLRVYWRRLLIRALLGLAGLQLVVYIALRLANTSWDLGYGLAIPAVLGLAIWALGRILPEAPEEPPPTEQLASRRRLPALLTAAIPVALGLGILRASFGDGVHTRELWQFGDIWRGWHGNLHPALLVFIAVVLLPVAAWGSYRGALRRAQMGLGQWFGLITFVLAVQGAFVLAVWADPWGTGEQFGAVSLFAAALGGAALLASLLVMAANAIGMPRSYERVRVRRVPLLFLLVVWLFVAARLDVEGPHDIRLLESARAAEGTDLDNAWACWLVKNGLQPPPGVSCGAGGISSPTNATSGVPLIFVASSGGATRAAYFTATVLDCAFEASAAGEENPCGGLRAEASDLRRTNHLFALSGVSGGSVGVSTFALHVAEKSASERNQEWIDERLERDFLSPTAGWALFVESTQAFLRFRMPLDRAEVLERSWERAWDNDDVPGDVGILELWRDHLEVPLLLLNGTSVEDGCRFNGSALDGGVETERGGAPDCRSTGPFDERKPIRGEKVDPLSAESVLPATRDLVDFLCEQPLDVRVSTVAIMSARFPYVSPSARFESQCDAGREEEEKATFVVDGGYLETSGASPIVEMWERLETLVLRHNATQARCIVPYMIQIDNGYEDDAAAPARARPSELLAPGQTIVAARGARAAQAKAAAALAFNRPFESAGPGFTDRYAHFVIQTHAGPKAPLGWALSKSAREELLDQLLQPKNEKALDEVRDWLDSDGLTCAEPAARRSVD